MANEDVLLHGDSITFTASRVTDHPGRIRLVSGQWDDYKTAEPGDKLEVRYGEGSNQVALVRIRKKAAKHGDD